MDENSPQSNIYTVTDITRSIKKTLEGANQFNNIWIRGEISNLTFHSSGHIYFSLKDENSVISAVFFKYANRNMKFKLQEGLDVLVYGNITVYEKRGSYQINVSMVKPEGIGELQKRIEELKKKLLEEGIFDDNHKKPIPFLPRKIGVVTSPTGAAVRDIIKVALRRYPNIEIIIAPVKVQGDGAADTIVRGIEELNRPEYMVDCIIAGRGGGSFEDLMPFNEEIVVRAFYNSRIPIISAVGHQVDHPLCDDAADCAAPTPSAAAEMAIPEKEELAGEIDYYKIRINTSIISKLRELHMRIDNVLQRRIFREPLDIIAARDLELSDLENRTIAFMKECIAQHRSRFLKLPDISSLLSHIIKNNIHRFNVAVHALDQLSPLSVLKRGYTIAIDHENKILRSVTDTETGNIIQLLMKDGSLECSVNAIKEGGGIIGKKEIP